MDDIEETRREEVAEQRQQRRLPLVRAERVRGTVEARGRPIRVGITNVSLGGAQLVSAHPDLAERRRDPLRLRLRSPRRSLGDTMIDIVHSRPVGAARLARRLGVRFVDQAEPFLQQLCRYLVEHHSQNDHEAAFLTAGDTFSPISDAKRVSQLLRYCELNEQGLKAFEVAGRPVGIFYPTRHDKAAIRGKMAWAPGARATKKGARYLLVLPDFTVAYLMPTTLLSEDQGDPIFSFSASLLTSGTRHFARVPLDSSFRVDLEFVHPQVPGKLVRKRVDEAGLSGLRFSLDIEQDLLVAGTSLESAMLRLPKGRSISCRGVVRHTFRRSDGSFEAGVQLSGLPRAGKRLWVRSLLQQLHPKVEEVSPKTLEQVWDVFDRSGYLEEKPDELLQPLEEPFRRAWGELLETDGSSRCWIFRDEGEAVGTVATSRIYQRTYLLHHMGVDLFHYANKRQSLKVLVDLAPRTQLQTLAALESASYVVTYFEAEKTFNKWSFFDFFSHNQGDLLRSQRLRMCDVQLNRLEEISPAAGVWVREANAAELSAISADLRRRDGPLLFEAFDYHPEAISLAALANDPEGAALRRERRVLVAGRGADFEAYALAESSAVGINIFALYDTCRVVLFATDAAAEAVRDALFFEAASGYRRRGLTCFLYLCGPGDAPPPALEGAFETEGIRTTMTCAIAKAWGDYADSTWSFG